MADRHVRTRNRLPACPRRRSRRQGRPGRRRSVGFQPSVAPPVVPLSRKETADCSNRVAARGLFASDNPPGLRRNPNLALAFSACRLSNRVVNVNIDSRDWVCSYVKRG